MCPARRLGEKCEGYYLRGPLALYYLLNPGKRAGGEEAGAANSGRVWPDDGFGPAYLENPWRRKRAPNRDSFLVHRLPQIDVLRRPFSTVPPARDRPSAPSSLLLARLRRSEPSRLSPPRVFLSPSVDLLGPP